MSSTPLFSLGLAAILALVSPDPIRAQTPGPGAPPPPDQIVTGGEGLLKAPPDRAFVTVTAEARSKAPREAQRANAQTMTAVQERLKALGIAGDAVRTLAIELQPEFDFANGKQTLRGYVARNSIEVRVDRIEQVGEVVDAAVAAGANNVSDIRFDVKDRATLEREALKQAVADARARAEAIAAGAGRSLDRILRIEDAGASVVPPPRPMYARAMVAEVAAPPETPVAPGQLEIRARVTLTVQMR